jgi:hypothetical protein
MPTKESVLICIRQEDTWQWPAYLDKQIAGECSICHSPIFYERKNEEFQKVCGRCWEALPAERAQLRPANYAELSEQDKWKIDKTLGLLDWDGHEDQKKT